MTSTRPPAATHPAPFAPGMKNALVILLLGAAAAAVSFVLVARLRSDPGPSRSRASAHAAHHAAASSHRGTMPATDDTALDWVSKEFHLEADAFERVRSLHAGYQPTCAALCRRIDEHNRRLATALLASKSMTPEIRRLVEEGARVRAECQTALAAHLLEVAHCMPPEQGRRYLELMLPATGITAASHSIDEFTHARPNE